MAVTFEHVDAGISGHVGNYDVFVQGDTLRVVQDAEDPKEAGEQVDGLGEFVEDAADLRLGWGLLPDDAEVIYVYDKADGCYGYAINLDWPRCSEWGYAPFEAAPEA